MNTSDIIIESDKTVILYHGSKSGIKGAIAPVSRKRCDFGHALDDTYDRLQWAGEEYILEELNEEVGGLVKSDNLFSIEVMFWAGYLYRYWHFYTGQSSKDIYTIADAKMMNDSWLGFHTLDNEMVIDDLMELYKQQ